MLCSPLSVDELALALQCVQRCLHSKRPETARTEVPSFSQDPSRMSLLLRRRQLLTALYEQVNPDLQRFLQGQSWKFSGVQSAEDLCNETWSLLLERLDAFDPDQASFTTWFHLYVVRLVLNRERRCKMRRDQHCAETLLEDLADARLASPLDSWPPECLALIRESVANMPLRWKAIILGLYFSDPPKKQTDLARALSISTAAVNQNKNRALAHLHALLDAQGYS